MECILVGSHGEHNFFHQVVDHNASSRNVSSANEIPQPEYIQGRK